MIQQPQISKTQIDSWFSTRGFDVLEYQSKTLLKVNESIFNQKLPTVLAAAPSSGKSAMSAAYIEFFLLTNPKSKVLVLTHGTTILRTQYSNYLINLNSKFTFKTIDENKRNFDAQVIVSLPQTLSTFKRLPKFDLLVVDEAHHFYFAMGKGNKNGDIGLVASIIKKVKPKYQLLLSGTPSIFIQKNFPIIPVTIEELLKVERVTDVIVELAISSYDLNSADFNTNKELKEKIAIAKLTRKNTDVTMDDLLNHILKRLTSAVKNNPKAYANLSLVSKFFVGKTWSDALRTLKKTMIACNNVEQALFVRDYLVKKNVNVTISTSKNDNVEDENSGFTLELNKFINDPNCLVLIVVRRGILGFNLPELENVIDMTCSYNPDTIFQLLGRVLRKHPKDKQKLFFKVVPTQLSNMYRAVMQVVALLTNEKYYTTFDGKNMLDARLFAEADVINKRKKFTKGKKIKEGTKKQPVRYVPISFEGVPFIKLFNDLIHEDEAILNGITYVTLRQVIDRINGYHATQEEQIAELQEIHS